MTVNELVKLIDAKNMVEGADGEREVSCGYTCDLLSWVMAHGAAGMAWVTVQTHMNVIAVASLMEMAAVIIPEDIEMEGPSLEKAAEEGIAVLQTPLTAYEICARLAAAGLPGKNREA
jgi:hypothetical protein